MYTPCCGVKCNAMDRIKKGFLVYSRVRNKNKGIYYIETLLSLLAVRKNISTTPSLNSNRQPNCSPLYFNCLEIKRRIKERRYIGINDGKRGGGEEEGLKINIDYLYSHTHTHRELYGKSWSSSTPFLLLFLLEHFSLSLHCGTHNNSCSLPHSQPYSGSRASKIIRAKKMVHTHYRIIM